MRDPRRAHPHDLASDREHLGRTGREGRHPGRMEGDTWSGGAGGPEGLGLGTSGKEENKGETGHMGRRERGAGRAGWGGNAEKEEKGERGFTFLSLPHTFLSPTSSAAPRPQQLTTASKAVAPARAPGALPLPAPAAAAAEVGSNQGGVSPGAQKSCSRECRAPLD